MEKKTKREGTNSGVWRLRKIFFGMYALLAKRFSLRERRVSRQGARHSTRTSLEYPLGSWMHLAVVHLLLEARGGPFRRSPRSRSRVNLLVLRLLTRRPQCQPSPPWTPHCRPGVQCILPTSLGQVLHGWPMAHHSMAIGFLNARGWSSALSVAQFSPLRFVRIPAMSRSPLPHPVPGLVTAPHSATRVYTPPVRQQPSGAGYLMMNRFVLLARVARIQSLVSACMSRLILSMASARITHV